MRTVRCDRSRVEAYQRCNRLRYLEYHAEGTGIVSAKRPLPLSVGSSVHAGLAILLELGQAGYTLNPLLFDSHPPNLGALRTIEEEAVESALEDFAQYKGTLALDTTEVAGQQASAPIPDDVMRQQLADSLGLSVEDAGLAQLQQQAGQGAAQFDDYLWQEQSALVEAMVRAYSRRRLRPLLEQYEVLEVEREGEWELAQWRQSKWDFKLVDAHEDWRLMFMSRPDALLRDRADNSLYILSFKTAASWDVRKSRDAQHDMQGLSEGVEVERRLGEWWDAIQQSKVPNSKEIRWGHEPWGKTRPIGMLMMFLADLPAPPRILGIRYEYLIKGTRWKDRDLSSRVGFEAWTQRSHLIRQYVAHSVPKAKGESAYHHGDVCWSWEWLKPDGTESKLAWQCWSSRPVWDQPGGVKGWIDALDASAMQMSQYDSTVGMEPREMGWAGPGQALGTTREHPLDAVFIPPIVVFRSEDSLRDLVEEMEAQETEVAENVAYVEAATDEGDRRSRLNRKFRRTLRACEWPSTCQFVKICHGPAEMRLDPMGSGMYRARVPNHPAELVSIKEASDAK